MQLELSTTELAEIAAGIDATVDEEAARRLFETLTDAIGNEKLVNVGWALAQLVANLVNQLRERQKQEAMLAAFIGMVQLARKQRELRTN